MKSLILVLSFCVSLSMAYGDGNRPSGGNASAIIAMDKFFKRMMPDHPECVELQHGRIALQNKGWCNLFVGRKIAGKIVWVKEIAYGDYWYASKKDADNFCKGTR